MKSLAPAASQVATKYWFWCLLYWSAYRDNCGESEGAVAFSVEDGTGREECDTIYATRLIGQPKTTCSVVETR
jgi:hypothetical protein